MLPASITGINHKQARDRAVISVGSKVVLIRKLNFWPRRMRTAALKGPLSQQCVSADTAGSGAPLSADLHPAGCFCPWWSLTLKPGFLGSQVCTRLLGLLRWHCCGPQAFPTWASSPTAVAFPQAQRPQQPARGWMLAAPASVLLRGCHWPPPPPRESTYSCDPEEPQQSLHPACCCDPWPCAGPPLPFQNLAVPTLWPGPLSLGSTSTKSKDASPLGGLPMGPTKEGVSLVKTQRSWSRGAG